MIMSMAMAVMAGDLGKWKFYRIAKAMVGLAQLEQEGKREEGAALNINKARINIQQNWGECQSP